MEQPSFYQLFWIISSGALHRLHIVNCVIAAITAGGDMINTRWVLSSPMVLDPTTRAQTSIIGNAFTLFFRGNYFFMAIGGLYWLVWGLLSEVLKIFPMYVHRSLDRIINLDSLVLITSNVFLVGMQIAAPVLLATLGQDIILRYDFKNSSPGKRFIRWASFFKPVLGALILATWILPMLMEVITDYITSFSVYFKDPSYLNIFV